MKNEKTDIPETRIQMILPIPMYRSCMKEDFDSTEVKEIEDIIREGMNANKSNSISDNNYIFKTKLKKIKEFCEHHLKKYVEEILEPKEELDFYITQSWINVTRPGESHHQHWHPNSIISGVFYVQTVEDDKIMFHDPNYKMKHMILINPKKGNIFNLDIWVSGVNMYDLVLFPSWLEHEVQVNEKQTKDRISISFNTFVKGKLGGSTTSELLLR